MFFWQSLILSSTLWSLLLESFLQLSGCCETVVFSDESILRSPTTVVFCVCPNLFMHECFWKMFCCLQHLVTNIILGNHHSISASYSLACRQANKLNIFLRGQCEWELMNSSCVCLCANLRLPLYSIGVSSVLMEQLVVVPQVSPEVNCIYPQLRWSHIKNKNNK